MGAKSTNTALVAHKFSSTNAKAVTTGDNLHVGHAGFLATSPGRGIVEIAALQDAGAEACICSVLLAIRSGSSTPRCSCRFRPMEGSASDITPMPAGGE
jgi:hypothetical protein